MNENDIKEKLRTKIFGQKIYCFDSIDSTNAYARTLASRAFEEGTVVIAEHQTAGRGRFDRQWVSTAGENLTFSILIRPRISPKRVGVLPLYAGLSVAEALREFPNISPSCKWPNDVLLSGQKCCGILCEGMFAGNALSAVIIGVGLNVNQQEFSPAIASSATSMARECGRAFDRAEVLAQLLEKFELNYSFIQNDGDQAIIRQWQSYCTMMGKDITIHQTGTSFTGTAKRIDNDGALIVSMNGAETRVLAGDVTLTHHETV